MTLDQYLAQQKEKEDSSVPKLEGTRKVSDDSWKDVVPLQKEGEDTYFVGKVVHHLRFISYHFLTAHFRVKQLPRRAPRRKKRFSLRSTPGLSVLLAAALPVAEIAVAAAVAEVNEEVNEVVAEVVVAVDVAISVVDVPTGHRTLLSMSTTKPPSPLSPDDSKTTPALVPTALSTAYLL